MGNPTLPDITDADASALSNTIHGGTGIRHIQEGVDDGDTPPLFTRLKQFEKHVLDLLERMGAACVNIESGLNVGVFALDYMIGSTEYAYAGDTSFLLTASSTNYLYLDTAATLKKSTSAWPSGDHYKIAKVVTGATDVTSITECRWMNFLIGLVNNWWDNLPTAEVDLNGQGLKGVKQFRWAGDTEITIAAGNIDPTGSFHTVDTAGDASADDLEKIEGGVVYGAGRILILRAESTARVVTIKHDSSNSHLWGDTDLALDTYQKFVVLQETHYGWQQVGGSVPVFTKLEEDLDANEKAISNVGKLILKAATSLTISSGAITITQDVHTVLNEGAASTDDLDTINGGTDGQMIVLSPGNGSQAVMVKSSGGNIRLSGANDFEMTTIRHAIILRYTTSLGWYELARSDWQLTHMVGTGVVLPFAIGPCLYTGTLSVNQDEFNFLATVPFKFTQARGYVVTAPSGGSCVVDILKNGASCFSVQADAINITTGNNDDTTAEVDVDFAIGDRLTVKVITANTAADLTVGFKAFTDAIEP